jgi:hypothetical protein
MHSHAIDSIVLTVSDTRKTGVELPDNGMRDEHGLQPIDGIFSSPEKTVDTPDGAAGSDGEQDMVIDSSELLHATYSLRARVLSYLLLTSFVLNSVRPRSSLSSASCPTITSSSKVATEN